MTCLRRPAGQAHEAAVLPDAVAAAVLHWRAQTAEGGGAL